MEGGRERTGRVIHVRLPLQLFDMLDRYSKQTGLRYSEIIRQALYEFLKLRV